MTGKHLRSKLKELRVPLIKVAEELGISKQSLNCRLNARAISTELLEAAARVSGKSPAYFYGGEFAEKTEQIKEYHAQLEAMLQSMMEKL